MTDRREILRSALALGAVVTMTSKAIAASAAPVEGVQYKKLGSSAPSRATSIEVLEFFSYACPHCFELEPFIEPWVKAQKPDVRFRRVPVPFLASSDNLMHSYYAFEAMGIVDQMTPLMFATMNVERKRLDTPESVAALVAKSGADAGKFMAVVRSFGVNASVSRARGLLGDYGVDSTPTLIVQGVFETSPALAGGRQEALNVTEFLIDSIRHVQQLPK